ncbi:MAG: Fic family protein [Patescibacteria group bacterium]
MKDILKIILEKKNTLDGFKFFPMALITNIDEWYKIELTYSSNAIEGNTLTRQETAQIVEKGITVKGKSIIEHLEAINHAKAYQYIKESNLQSIKKIDKRTILDIHAIILGDINTIDAGIYRNIPVRIAGSTVTLPNPFKVPDLMEELINWLHQTKNNIVKIAVDAHFKLVTIHPFIDGNGRTARLLMNLILITAGYPPVIINKEDRKKYIDSIEKGQLSNDLADYYFFMFGSVNNSLDIYLKALGTKEKQITTISQKLMKIGELANKTTENVSTIRFWTKAGLLKVKKFSAGGYQLYDSEAIKRINEIRKLKKEKRLTITELKHLFS